MNYKTIKTELLRIKNDPKNWEITDSEGCTMDEGQYMSNYLGTYMSLDPCGKYHHFLSPNGVTKKCEQFWSSMDKAAQSLDMWIQSGEGDPCDIFLCKNIEETDK
jgi:hypothetical protein